MLNVEVNSVKVHNDPTDKEDQIIKNLLRCFDSNYDNTIYIKHQRNIINITNKFFIRKDHYIKTSYTIKTRLCGNTNRTILNIFGQEVRTPFTTNGKLIEVVLRWLDNRIIDPSHRDHYMFTETTRQHIKFHNPPLKQHMKNRLYVNTN